MAREHEVSFIQACRQVFDEQQRDVKQKLKLAAKALDRKDVKKLFDASAWTATLQAALHGSYANLIAEAAQTASMLVSTHVFDNADPAIEAYIKQRSGQVSEAVNVETDKQLKASLIQGLYNGEDTGQLLARVDDVFGAAAGFRSERIARTETIRSSTQASIMAWNQSDVVKEKEWFTAHDERVCPACDSMDGQIIGLNSNYFDKGDTYTATGDDGTTQTLKLDFEDIIGPPLHVNCRCTLLPVLV